MKHRPIFISTCPKCKRDYPDELFSPLCIDGEYITVCPLCVKEILLEVHGFIYEPQGEGAKKLMKDAEEYFKKHYV